MFSSLLSASWSSTQLCDLRSPYGIRGRISHKVRSNILGWLLSAAISLAMDGHYGRACQALTSSGVAPDTDEIWNLHVQHPHFPPPISNLLHALDTYNQSASLDTPLTATDVVNTKFCQKKLSSKIEDFQFKCLLNRSSLAGRLGKAVIYIGTTSLLMAIYGANPWSLLAQ